MTKDTNKTDVPTCPRVSRREMMVLTGEAVLAGTLIGCGAEEMHTGACAGAGTGTAVPPAELPAVGEAKFFPAGSSDPIFLIAQDEQGYMAIKNYCTHSGCSVRFTEQKTYFCDCHGSEFQFDGGLIRGPAVRPLDHLSMCRRTDGTLVVDRTKTLPDTNSRVK